MKFIKLIASAFAVTAVMLASAFTGPLKAADDIVVGFIGSFASDTGKSTLRGAEIAIEELNAKGGILGGRKIKLVTADTREDVTEGIKAYEYLAETAKADFIISGSIDDVSLGWLPRMVEYKIPTLDTWTSYIGIIDKVVKEYDKYKMYFMNVASDEALATLYIDFGKDVLAKQMGWKTVVILQEDTAFGGAIHGLVKDVLAPEAGIKILDTIVYDVNTVDFAPIFAKAQKAGADFIYTISSVKGQVVASQYVKLQVPLAMTGVNVGTMGHEYWDDTGGAGGGVSSLSPLPSVGFALDDTSKAFVDTYKAKYGSSRPVFPHFNGFNAYHGMKQAMAAADKAGGFKPLDAWVKAMENEDVIIKKDGKMWLRYGFWKPGEIEPRTKREYTHNIKFDITPPFDDGAPSMVVIQWYEDGTSAVVYPPKYATGKFTVPSWVKK
ncbi:MAG: ABC transporter substrate-binding protein [Alphaproteobacteria bacterium]|nr:ABC transporter substrate-binding protein [Alphaproteobacteria bacterium]